MAEPLHRFRLGLDLDGVCADYVAHLAEIIERERGLPSGSLPLPYSWNFGGWDLTGDEYRRLHHDAEEAGMWTRLAPYPGAVEGVRRLRDAGVYVHIVTARHRPTPDRLHLTAADTAKWCDKHGLHADALTFTCDKADIGCDLYLEDSPSEIARLLSREKQVLVFDRSHNQHDSRLDGLPLRRVATWDEAVQVITGQMTAM